MLIGSLFTLAGFFLVSVINTQPPTTHAQDNTNKVIDEIVCKTIRVVNDKGRPDVVIGSDRDLDCGGIITIYNAYGKENIVMKASAGGPSGTITTHNGDGEEQVYIGRGAIIISNLFGEKVVSLEAEIPGLTGGIEVNNREGIPLVKIGAQEGRVNDGLINVYNHKGEWRSISKD